MKTIGNVTPAGGRIRYGSLLFEGHKIPVCIAAGQTDGPTLLVIGMQHTTEFSGPGAIDRVLDEIPIKTLAGQLVCLPFVNPLQLGQTPEEFSAAWKDPSRNLNRQWPGDASSENPLSRLAALIWNAAVADAAAVMDLHCCRAVDPRFAACLDGFEAGENFAAALGLDAVDAQTPASYHGGQLFIAASQRLGIPAALVESHPSDFQVREAVEACSGAVFRAMLHLGMLPQWQARATARTSTALFRRAEPAQPLKTATAGYLGVRRWAGDSVRKGDAVAVVRSLETFDIGERLISPLDGAVGCVGDPAGEALVKAGTAAATAKRVRWVNL